MKTHKIIVSELDEKHYEFLCGDQYLADSDLNHVEMTSYLHWFSPELLSYTTSFTDCLEEICSNKGFIYFSLDSHKLICPSCDEFVLTEEEFELAQTIFKLGSNSALEAYFVSLGFEINAT